VNEDLVYYLGRVAAGATVNLGAARTKSCSDAGLKWENRPMFMYQETPPSGPFSLLELVQRWGYDPHRDHENNAVFLGLSDAPVLGAEITGQPIIHTQHSVVVVSLESAP